MTCPTTENLNPRNLPVILHHVALAELAKEVLVVCNDD